MTTLFTAADLTAYRQVPTSTETYNLAHELTLDALKGEVGDRISDPPQPGIKSLALSVAARLLTNPGGVRSESAGGMAISYADAQTGVILTEDERRRLRRSVGIASGAGMLNITPEDVARPARVWRAL
ncbi:hypothetical protein ACFQ8W_00490 [Streptomyces sp. NPDC056508]|uniref:hypothetical protein n=1 Tax=Streptomyces sp. NPDC056508 TaxID=3345845 RepID=UPI0036AB7AE1